MDCPKCKATVKAGRWAELDLAHAPGIGTTAKVISLTHTIWCESCGFTATADTLSDVLEHVEEVRVK